MGIRILAIVAVLAAVPLCAALGTARYHTAQREIRAENASKTQVSALITSAPKPVTWSNANGAYHRHYEATVRWDREGRHGKATAEVDSTARLGDDLALWLGPDGRPSGPPQPASAAVWRGIGLGVGALAQILVTVLTATWLTTWLLTRRREAGQQR
ncbi:hypothetical protein NDR87_29920 [Nocardia sp. CDC159]|uniref:DUF3592 domain-containing protein n=1 Tax=Nocardia pulmonis TaxID=2951408 RepID=A0A9X2EG15_9NOCA|nr:MULTISPECIES: hypothetical protein [Nocardia]MCM6777601.1 hypothetical protein [Nocardia pulmonis]MCM6790595.1 hypothetical protein [Nocardia sp. CDC159]